MSTAGKVLVVLVMVLTLVWLLLVSAVAQLNRNYGAELARLQAQIPDLEKNLDEARAELMHLKNEIAHEQVLTDQAFTELRARLSLAERALALTVEEQESLKYQLQTYNANKQAAEEAKELRNVEKADTEKQLADARAQVETTKAENAKLLDQLQKLRGEFTTLLAENRQLLRKLTPPSRPASTSRPVRTR
jgi:chromosome segregation ATPase